MAELVGYRDVVTIAGSPGTLARALFAAQVPGADTPERRQGAAHHVAAEPWERSLHESMGS
jgi:hypothetical protein